MAGIVDADAGEAAGSAAAVVPVDGEAWRSLTEQGLSSRDGVSMFG